MKILLVNVPWSNDGFLGVRAGSRWPHIKIKEEEEYMPYPFFLGYSYSLLKKNKFEVKLIDALAEKLSDDDFFKESKLFSPDLILIESSITSLKNDLEFAKKLKKKTNAIIIFSGPLNHFYTKDFFQSHDYIDYACIGEYEFTLLELANAYLKKKLDSIFSLKGLIINNGKNTNITLNYNLIDNLDLLPWPERKSLNMNNYIDAPGDMPLPCVQIIATRGCPYKCTFCMWPQIMYKRKFRVRSTKDIVDEMEFLINEMEFKSIYFDDDTFNVGKLRMIEICDEIIKRKIKISWAIMARADLMDKEILHKFKKAGLYAIKYGVETADINLMKVISKDLNLNKVISIVKLTKELGIKTHLTFTFGIPGETWETVNKTINLALELDPFSLQFSILTPFPETVLYNQLKKDNKILETDFSKYDGNYGSVIKTDALSKMDLENAIIIAYAKWNIHKNRTYFDLKKKVSEKESIIKDLVDKATFQDKTHEETYDELKNHINLLANRTKERDLNVKKVNNLLLDKKDLSKKLNDHSILVKNLTAEMANLHKDIFKLKIQLNLIHEDKKFLSSELNNHVVLVKKLTKDLESLNFDNNILKKEIFSMNNKIEK